MSIKSTKSTWERWAAVDPVYGIINLRGKSLFVDKDQAEFFSTGRSDVEKVVEDLSDCQLMLRGQTAVDFGCGIGRITQNLSRYFGQVIGVDISSMMIEIARRLNNNPNVTYLGTESTSLGFLKSGSVDFIFCLYVLQHNDLEDVWRLLEQFYRILKPGGLAYFQIPDSRKYAGFVNLIRSKTRFRTRLFGLFEILGLANHFIYRRLGLSPPLKMTCISKDQITQRLEQFGGKVVSVLERRDAGNEFLSYRYIFKKDSE